jgi:glucose-1-phosphate adenylyltransferase
MPVHGLQIGENTTIKDAMIMGADFYESDAERAAKLEKGEVPIGVGSGSSIANCILDKGARIGKNVTISNAAGVEEANLEEKGYYIRSGIVVVIKGKTIPDNTVI